MKGRFRPGARAISILARSQRVRPRMRSSRSNSRILNWTDTPPLYDRSCTAHMKRLSQLLVVMLLAMQPVRSAAQQLQQTFVVEGYNCNCAGSPVNSVQLGVRLDRSLKVYTALSTLVGCGRILLNVDGERFPVRISLANARDNVATLEPIDLASSIPDLEKRLKKAPNYKVPGSAANPEKDLNMVVLKGADLNKEKRPIGRITLYPDQRAGFVRYRFRLANGTGKGVQYERLMGGPVWYEQGGDQLIGLVTGMLPDSTGVDLMVTGVESVLDKRQGQLYHAYLATFRSAVDAGCGPREVYWDGFETYRYRSTEKPRYDRIDAEDRWDRSLHNALLRIRAHMADSIPTSGENQEGRPSLCVFVNDLENVYKAFAEQATETERANWPVLPRFVKAYSGVHCKRRKYSEAEFTRDIIELNFWMDQIGGDELRLLYSMGFDWMEFEGFVKRYFLLSQVGGIRRRYDGLMDDRERIGDPCVQRAMLEELDGLVKDWSRHVGQVQDLNYSTLLQYRNTLALQRDGLLQAKLDSLGKDKNELQAALEAIEGDSCLTGNEKMRLTRVVREMAVDEEQEDLDYGIDVVEQLRGTISTAFGDDALANVMTKIFRVEGGVGVELTIRGGGAILDKKLRSPGGDASDTTTVYRSGFPVGSVGDTLSATIAQVFWERMCEDYASRKWQYRTESVEITGMADGIPVRSALTFTEACRAAMEARGVVEPNAQLAFARAWSLHEQIAAADRCGLFELLNPAILHRTFEERGGEFRGVSMRAIMKRKG